jgi:hypothetical protein
MGTWVVRFYRSSYLDVEVTADDVNEARAQAVREAAAAPPPDWSDAANSEFEIWAIEEIEEDAPKEDDGA